MLRQYIRDILLEGNSFTFVYEEESKEYSSNNVLEQSKELCQECDLALEGMDLAYFSRDMGDITGCAWVGIRKNKFNFSVITDEETPDFVYEHLVMDCMDEFDFLVTRHPNLKLEVIVDDEETETFLKENCDLRILRSYPGISVMGR